MVTGGPDDQGVVLSSEPGRDDYTPAWTLHRVAWIGEPGLLSSVADVESTASAGDVTVEKTEIVCNAEVVKWSNGELSVDPELRGYFGPGLLIEAADPASMQVTFSQVPNFDLSRKP